MLYFTEQSTIRFKSFNSFATTVVAADRSGAWHSCAYRTTIIDGWGFGSQQGRIFLSKVSRPVLESTQLRIQWIPGFFPWAWMTSSLYLTPRLNMSGALPPRRYMPSWRGQVQVYVYFFYNGLANICTHPQQHFSFHCSGYVVQLGWK